MRSFFIFIFLFMGVSAFGQTLPADILHFSYKSHDGDKMFNCTHKTIPGMPYDYQVNCFESQFKREFRVHFSYHIYPRPALKLTSYEILYWVTELTKKRAPKPQTGGTHWYHFNGAPEMVGFTMTATVDSDTAALWLQVGPSLK